MTDSSNPSSPPKPFDGPLDLLLDEVRRQHVAIENIALAPLVARFLAYVRFATRRHLNLDIEWLHMAATLILWKSRSLLPAGPGEPPAADPLRDSLIAQLVAHRRQVAEELGRRKQGEEARLARSAAREFREEPPPAEEDLPFVSVWDLLQQARELARWARQQSENRREWQQTWAVEVEPVTVAEMMELLRAELSAAEGKLDGSALLASQPTGAHRACLFLGMLEMARSQRVALEQDEEFGPIWLSTAVYE